jgi:hypothetical protein
MTENSRIVAAIKGQLAKFVRNHFQRLVKSKAATGEALNDSQTKTLHRLGDREAYL